MTEGTMGFKIHIIRIHETYCGLDPTRLKITEWPLIVTCKNCIRMIKYWEKEFKLWEKILKERQS